MRKVIFAINTTLDGCCDHTKGVGSEDVHEYHTRLLQDVDVLVFGRKTYQLMYPFWPDVAKNPAGHIKTTIDFAQAFTSVNKNILFSRTLDKVDEKNTTIIRTNLRDEILKLKQEQGKDILTGGVDIPTQLMELDLIDEYRLIVQPVIAGKGRRLFEDVNLQDSRHLKFVDSTTLKSGSIALRYVKQ